MKSKIEIAEFYDRYISNQRKGAYNERHFFLLKELERIGLKTDSNILEIGCGIGVISSLLAKTVKKGKVISMDISPRSIEVAKENNKKSNNIEFEVSDAANFNYLKLKFDFITLFDVLEHIPIEQHPEVFKNIANHMGEETILFINIPNPSYLEYIIQNNPEQLQVVDQPLPANIIMNNAYNNRLELLFFHTYSIWIENDYQMMLFSKKKPFEVNPL